MSVGLGMSVKTGDQFKEEQGFDDGPTPMSEDPPTAGRASAATATATEGSASAQVRSVLRRTPKHIMRKVKSEALCVRRSYTQALNVLGTDCRDPHSVDSYSLVGSTLSCRAAALSLQANASSREADAEPMGDDAKPAASAKAEAKAEKEAGNAAYKKRQFDEAIQHYNRALELDDSDISYLTNRSAAP